MLRKISEPRSVALRENWIKLHIEQLHGLYCSPHIIGVINKKTEIGWTYDMYGDSRCAYWVVWENWSEREHLEDIM